MEQITKLIQINPDENIKLWTVKCVEAVVYKNEMNKNTHLNVSVLDVCSGIFQKILLEETPKKCDEILYCKVCFYF